MKKPAKRSPAFQFYPSNFLGSPKVRAMSAAEIGVYMLCLCLDWEHDGFTIDEARELAESARVTAKQFDTIWERVSRSFENDSGRFFNARLEKERKKQRAWRRKSSKGGKIGMAKRWGKRDKGGNEMVTPPHNTPSLSPSPSPTNNKPTARRASRAAPEPESWLVTVSRSYESRKGEGSFPFPKAGKLLKPLRDAGHSGEEIALRLGRYLDWLDDPKYLNLAKFRETFGDYAEDEPAAVRALGGYPRITDDFGCFTEYGERVTRPAGFKPMLVA